MGGIPSLKESMLYEALASLSASAFALLAEWPFAPVTGSRPLFSICQEPLFGP